MAKKILLLAMLIACSFAGTAKAQLFLEEGKVVLAVSGGDRINKSLLIDNTSADTADVKVYWEDFSYQPPYDGSKMFLPAGTGVPSASTWISYSPQTFSVPSYGKQKVDYTITVPDQIKEGHYGVLFFEKSDNNSLNEVTGMKIVTRVGCLFFIEPKDKLKKAALQNFKFTASDLSGDFVNQSNGVLIPHLTYYIMDKEGMVPERGEIKKLYIPANTTAPWQMPVPSQLKMGKFTMVINADLDEGSVVVKEIEFSKDTDGKLIIEAEKD